MGKVCGAIEGIHIPAIVAAGVSQTLLFAENIVAGPEALDALPDQNFRLAIRYRDQVGITFVLDLHMLLKILHQQSARLAGDLRHRGNKLMIGLSH